HETEIRGIRQCRGWAWLQYKQSYGDTTRPGLTIQCSWKQNRRYKAIYVATIQIRKLFNCHVISASLNQGRHIQLALSVQLKSLYSHRTTL
ncbi:unnamed protein product, partial [Allacma fusca]